MIWIYTSHHGARTLQNLVPMLLEAWREAGRHLEIGEAVERVAPLLARRLPADLVLVRWFDLARGCVETLVGQESIARAAGISPGAGRTRSLTDELVRRAQEGSPEVLGALSDAGHWLGIALASTFNVLDLQAVVLGGCFGPLSPWLVDEVRATLEERSLAARSGSFGVLPSAFGDGAAVRGAAALSLRRVLDQPWTVGSSNGTAPARDPARALRPAEKRGKEVAIGRR